MKKRLIMFVSIIVILSIGLTACTNPSVEKGKPSTPPSESKSDASLTPSSENKEDVLKWPQKPITLVLGYSAGGSSDIMCRLLAGTLQKNLGQPVVVVNKPGSGGWVAWTEIVKNTAPDGYTFCLINSPYINLGAYDPTNKRDIKYDDLDLLINHVSDYNVLAIRKDETRFADLKTFVEYAKKNEVLSGASAVGIISDDASTMERLNKEYGTKITIVPTPGAKDTEIMFISKNTDILVGNVGDTLQGHQKGDYKVIAVFAPERSKLMPDVPTCKELGMGEIYSKSSRGYAFPKGVDPAIKEKMLAALEKSINDPEVIDKLNTMGAETHVLKGEEYHKFLGDEIEVAKKAFDIK